MSEFFYRLFRPQFWSQNYPTSHRWGELLDRLMDKNAPVEIENAHTATIGGVMVWTANWPYAYGSPSNGFGSGSMLPPAKTRTRLRDYLFDRQAEKVFADLENGK